jgi:DNA invertase Pin-like site-specific DNA recombinase
MDVGYARVSTEDQHPEVQIAALEKAGCWPIYQERASGRAGAARPVRDQVLREVKAGDRLTVWKLDRLGRSLVELQQIVTDLERRSVRFRSLTESIDTSTAQGRLFFQLLAAFAEFERTLIVERTKAGKRHAAEQGKSPGGHRMYGTVGTGKEQVPPEQAGREVNLLREAARLMLDGAMLGRIVDDWNRRGVPTKSGKGQWNESILRRILLHPRMVDIINEDTYQRLQALFNRPNRQKQGPPAKHLLSGILRCSKCNQPMYSGIENGKPVYRCRRAMGSGGRHTGCGAISISMRRTDEWMLEAFIEAVCGPDSKFTETLNQRRAALLAGDVTPQQIDEWRAEIDELETILATRFGVRDPQYKARHDELQRYVKAATATLVQRPELEELLDLPKTEAGLRKAWDGWDVDRRRHYLKAMLECVWVLPAPEGHRTGRRFDARSRLEPDWIL